MLKLDALLPGAEHFYVYEAVCKCDDPDCHFGREEGDVPLRQIQLLERIRLRIGGPVRPTSWCRCEKHNQAVGGAKNSTHKLAEATDIQVEGGRHRRMVLDAAILEGAEGVGVANGFIHVDSHRGSAEVPRPSAWSY